MKIHDRFGRWTVMSEPALGRVVCRCDCGTERSIPVAPMLRGRSKSCGCLRAEILAVASITHWRSRSKIYKVWRSMINRCETKSDTNFYKYGARGIKVCSRWRKSFPFFLADMGERPAGTSIDRVDNSGDYEPSNCKWSQAKEQARNKRNNRKVEYLGRMVTMAELAEISGLQWDTIKARIDYYGWSVARAMSTPASRGGRIAKAEARC